MFMLGGGSWSLLSCDLNEASENEGEREVDAWLAVLAALLDGGGCLGCATVAMLDGSISGRFWSFRNWLSPKVSELSALCKKMGSLQLPDVCGTGRDACLAVGRSPR